MEKVDIKSMTLSKLEEFCTGQGLAKFRAGQIFQWMHQKQVDSFEQMTNLPVELRKTLSETCRSPDISTRASWFLKSMGQSNTCMNLGMGRRWKAC